MDSLKVSWKHSIFIRLIITFLLIMVPIFIFGIWIFKWSSNQLSEEISYSMKSQVSYYMNNFDNEIQRIKDLQFDLTQDEDLNQVANASELMDNFEKTKAILRIQRRLTAIKNSSPYIDNVKVFIPSLKWAINDADANKSYSDITSTDIDLVKDIPTDSDSQMIFMDDKLFLIAVFPIYNENREPLFIIRVDLSKEAIKKALEELYSFSDGGFILEKASCKFTLDNISDENIKKQLPEIIALRLDKNRSDAVTIIIDGKRYLLIYYMSEYTGMTLAQFLPQESGFQAITKLELWYWLFFLLTVAVIVIYSLYSYKLIRKPLAGLLKSFRKVESGDFQINVKYLHNDELGNLYKRFGEMVENLKKLIDQVYKQKILAQNAELKQLQAQINPHFLYNSFFILHRRIKGGDYDNAIRFSQQLGNYFRFITRSAADEVTLAREVEHAGIYAEIQGMRFSNRIRVEIAKLPEEIHSVIVPRLILQPIIENAFEYGLENKKSDGKLVVGFETNDKKIIISIEDNGEDLTQEVIDNLNYCFMNADSSVENTGIINIHRRIKLKFGENSGLKASRSILGGLKIDMDISAEWGENSV